jgi:nicotinic acid phosphoribosyltransferase
MTKQDLEQVFGRGSVSIDRDGKPHVKFAGKIVAVNEIFAVKIYGKQCVGKEIVHKDGNLWNFRSDNLALKEVK